MSRRALKWIAVLGALDVLDFALTLHTSLTYTPSNSSAPSVLPLGAVLGWIVFGVLLIAVLLIVKESRR